MSSPTRSRPWSSFFAVFILTLSLAATIGAQEGTILDKSKLPACALQCNLLVSAQTLCVPPTAPVASQAIYQTCFCNSNYMVPFKAGTPSGVCDAECPAAADRQQILTWYTGVCTGGAIVTPANGNGVGAAVPNTPTPTAPATTSTATTSSSGSSTFSSKKNGSPTWISTHYRWVIMLIVLILAAIAAIFLGLWLKRRHNKKHSNNRDTMLAAEDATNHLRNKHPDAPSSMSQIQIPNWDGSVLMSGGNSNSREALGTRSGTGTSKGKGPADSSASIKEMGFDDAGPSSHDEERNIGFAQSLTSKMKKKNSKSSRKSKKSVKSVH